MSDTSNASRLDALVARASAALAAHGDFPHRVRLDFGDEGGVWVDGPAGKVEAQGPRSADVGEDEAADLELSLTLDDFVALARGELDPGMAVLKRRIRVAGDLGLAAHLGQLMKAAPDP